MTGNYELSATVHAEMNALFHGPLASVAAEPTGGRAYWRSKAHASPSAYRLQRLRRDSARRRLVAQLMGDTQRHPEGRIDEALAESFPASDPPYWTLGVEHRPEVESPWPPVPRAPDDRVPEKQPSSIERRESTGGRLLSPAS